MSQGYSDNVLASFGTSTKQYLFLDRTWTMTASASYSGTDPTYTVDGTPATVWHSSVSTAGEWIQADAGANLTVDKIEFQLDNNQNNGNVKLEYSLNGTDWTQIGDQFYFARGSTVSRDFGTISARYWRLTSISAVYLSIDEIYMYLRKPIPENVMQIASMEPTSPSVGDVWVNPSAAAAGSVASGAFSWSGATGAASGSAFAWKGTGVIPSANVEISSIFFNGTVTSGATYQGAVVTYSGTTISSITKTLPAVALSTDAETTNGIMMVSFSSPIALSSGVESFRILGRTDSTDTFAFPIQYPNSRGHFPFGGMGATASIRVAKASPAIGDTVDLFATGTARVAVLWRIV